jgi:hypothetical protein
MLRGADDASVFGRDSHVREYWLANAAGFEVRRNRRVCGRVEDVLVDGEFGHATTLLVREPGRRRPTLVPAHRVAAVDPFVRQLYLEQTPSRPRTERSRKSARAVARTTRVAAQRSAPHARRAAVGAAALTRAAGAAARRGWIRLRPQLLALSLATARGARRAAAAAIEEIRPLVRELRLLAARRSP